MMTRRDHSELVSGCVSHRRREHHLGTAIPTEPVDGAVTVTLGAESNDQPSLDMATSGTTTVPQV
ncbi:hypothetical protein OK016_00265 [Vibrio chagasii]|nr:hypothetical protein [Vibrio chagasii]